MNEEIKNLIAKETFVVVQRPKGVKVSGTKWVLKIKKNCDGSIERFKGRVVAKGFSQSYGIDCSETSSPVIKKKTVRVLFALAARNKWCVDHVDILTAYLSSPLTETIYVEPPVGFNSDTNKVWKLLKSLHGLKQSAYEWYNTIHKLLVSLGMTRLKVCVRQSHKDATDWSSCR